jgi:hypothetical protein
VAVVDGVGGRGGIGTGTNTESPLLTVDDVELVVVVAGACELISSLVGFGVPLPIDVVVMPVAVAIVVVVVAGCGVPIGALLLVDFGVATGLVGLGVVATVVVVVGFGVGFGLQKGGVRVCLLATHKRFDKTAKKKKTNVGFGVGLGVGAGVGSGETLTGTRNRSVTPLTFQMTNTSSTSNVAALFCLLM